MAQQGKIESASSLSAVLEAATLSHNEDDKTARVQSGIFRIVEEGNFQLLSIVFKTHTADINFYNEQGMTPLHLAVYKYETQQKLDVLELLLKHGADVCAKAAPLQPSLKLSLGRRDMKGHEALLETKKISLDQKTPLLLALELKSALFLKGWQYRHWDAVLKLLAGATVKSLEDRGVVEYLDTNPKETTAKGWRNVFETGDHSLIDVRAEGKEIRALKLLLSSSSQKFKQMLDTLTASGSNTLELKDVSFNMAKVMVQFIYTGDVGNVDDPKGSKLMEKRGLDLLQAAHKYGVDALKVFCELQVQPTQDNWIKMLTVAGEVSSDVLVLKCVRSIHDTMTKRHEGSHVLLKSFSESDGGPNQLFPAHS